MMTIEKRRLIDAQQYAEAVRCFEPSGKYALANMMGHSYQLVGFKSAILWRDDLALDEFLVINSDGKSHHSLKIPHLSGQNLIESKYLPSNNAAGIFRPESDISEAILIFNQVRFNLMYLKKDSGNYDDYSVRYRTSLIDETLTLIEGFVKKPLKDSE